MSTVLKTEQLSATEKKQVHEIGGVSGGPGTLRRVLLTLAGTVFVALGVLGALLPVLPTTPFLLLAAACYLRSSARLYRRLLNNRIFGEHLRRYRAGEGLPRAFKIWTVALLWTTLSASAFFAVPARLWWVRLLLLAVGIGVTIHLVCIPTFRSDKRSFSARPEQSADGGKQQTRS
ncbi:MAG: YbaN family protein [Spirochaetales bacterium]|nr:YbaN family protein [Spirochaetales bacterium]